MITVRDQKTKAILRKTNGYIAEIKDGPKINNINGLAKIATTNIAGITNIEVSLSPDLGCIVAKSFLK